MVICSDEVNPISKYRKWLSATSIGIGLGFFLLWNLTGWAFGDSAGYVGLVAFVLGVVWFLIERRKIGFSKIVSVITIVVLPIATVLTYVSPPPFLYLFPLGFIRVFVFALPTGLALLFVACGFFAIGLVGVYIDRKPKKIGLSFMVTGSLFAVFVALVNLWQVRIEHYRYGMVGYIPVYREITPPLILMGSAFFLLGSIMILNSKFQVTKRNLREKIGFSFLVFSSTILIGAAINYTSGWGMYGLYSFFGDIWSKDTIPLIFLSAAILVLGSALMLHKNSKRFGLFCMVSGSFTLIANSFAYGYQTKITEVAWDNVTVSRRINPLREYVLPLFLASLVISLLGYVIMLKKRE